VTGVQTCALPIFNQEIIDEYVNEYWQKGYKYQKEDKWQYNIKQIETLIYNWKKDNKETIRLTTDYYVGDRFNEIFPYEKFVKLLEKQTCYYCDISEEEIETLISKHKINKKKVTRGWTLEIDRKKPNLEYTDDNCVRCCYWCNSAKTDEFDDIEFIPIGESIKKIWNERLNI
jgi:glutamyl/glutaminyl-tRNA synthetase